MKPVLSAFALLIAAAPSGVGARPPGPCPAGLTVEELGRGSALERAGARRGDVLVSWQRRPEAAAGGIGGRFEAPFQVADVEVEEVPRGPIVLALCRGGEEVRVPGGPGRWLAQVRPPLRDEDLAEYRGGAGAGGAGEAPDPGARPWARLAERWSATGRHGAAAWLYGKVAAAEIASTGGDGTGPLGRAVAQAEAAHRPDWAAHLLTGHGRALLRRGEPKLARELLEQGLERRRAMASESLAVAESLFLLGKVLRLEGTHRQAGEQHRRALALRRRLGPGSLVEAESLLELGALAAHSGDRGSAEELFRQALELQERRAPDGPEVATSLRNLGGLAYLRGDTEGAEDLFRRALEIQERILPGGVEMAASLNGLGIVASLRSDLAAAESHFSGALGIWQRRAPGSITVAYGLNNLGLIARQRGDLWAAEDFYRQALAIKEELAPESLELAATLNNLGTVCHGRGDLVSAAHFHSRALAIKERIQPRSLDTASSLANLGLLAQERGDRSAAQGYHHRALALRQELAPNGLEVAISHSNLGGLELLQGDPAAAEASFRKALEIATRQAPDSLRLVDPLAGLAAVALLEGDEQRGEELYLRALDLQSRLAPGALGEARISHALGRLYGEQGRMEPAFAKYRQALAALDAHTSRLGGSDEVRAGFAGSFADVYFELAELLRSEGRSEESFLVAERAKARALRLLLTERDLRPADGVPAELLRERDAANAEYDRVLRRLESLTAADERLQEELREGLLQARMGQESIRSRIRSASPRVASLEDPEALGLDAVKKVLDPGTLLLSYLVGERRSLLFVLGPDPGELAVHPLELDRGALRRQTTSFRTWIRRRSQRAASGDLPTRLWAQLLAPAADSIARAERLMIAPDGPLHYLPFAALRLPGEGDEGPYLAEAKPLFLVSSASVFAQLRAARGGTAQGPSEIGPQAPVYGFADPRYPGPEPPSERVEPRLRSLLARGLRLESLPASRDEVAALERLYGGAARLFLGAAATEEAVKAIRGPVSILHLAGHGLVDDRSPLDSALALAIPEVPGQGRDNGLLQVWEVLEEVRFDADLVTLSACETALGKEVAGEGILGLTRSFQYAGARTVLASLWRVDDRSTAELMKRFYGHYRRGESKAEALRKAQLDFLSGRVEVPPEPGGGPPRDPTHPYHWAAFQLYGDG